MTPEITAPVALLDERGRLDRAAVGWTRTPLHDTSGVARRRRWRPPVAWGRNKRWEYWAVITPTHVVALVVSSIDYAAVHGIFCLDRRTGQQIAHDAIGVLGDPRPRSRPLALRHRPAHLRRAVTDLKVFFSKTHQAFGTWAGRVRDADGTWVEVRDAYGFAEDVHNRW